MLSYFFKGFYELSKRNKYRCPQNVDIAMETNECHLIYSKKKKKNIVLIIPFDQCPSTYPYIIVHVKIHILHNEGYTVYFRELSEQSCLFTGKN